MKYVEISGNTFLLHFTGQRKVPLVFKRLVWRRNLQLGVNAPRTTVKKAYSIAYQVLSK